MADRSSLFEVVQVFPEGTAGVTATANGIKLQTMSIEPGIQADIQTFRPSGQKFGAVAVVGKEWSEASVSGRADYNELIYPLSSVISRTTPTELGEANGTAYQWVFSPAISSADNPISFSIEQGSGAGGRAHRMIYGIFTEFGMSFSRDGIELSGSLMGRRVQDGLTLTGDGTTSTQLALKPVLPTDTSVYIADAQGDLDTADAQERVLSVEWTLSDRYGPVWVLNSENDSWAAVVETEPSLEMTMMMMADTEGMALLETMRQGATKFIRVEALGGTIAGGGVNKYTLRVDTAAKVSSVGNFSDEDGIFAIEWTMTAMSEGSWGGKATEVTVINTIESIL